LSSRGVLQLDGGLVRIKRLVPQTVEPCTDGRDASRIELVSPPRPILPRRYQARVLQDLEVLRDGRTPDGKAPGDLDDRQRPTPKLFEDRAPGAVPERIEEGVGSGRSTLPAKRSRPKPRVPNCESSRSWRWPWSRAQAK
jgi:hypothetical protein